MNFRQKWHVEQKTLTISCHDSDDFPSFGLDVNALQDSLPAGSVLDIVADVSELEVWVLEHAGLVVVLEGVTAVNFVQAEVPPSPHTVVSHPLVLLLVHVFEAGVESSLRGVGEAVVEDGCVVTVAQALTLHSQKVKVRYANHSFFHSFLDIYLNCMLIRHLNTPFVSLVSANKLFFL